MSYFSLLRPRDLAADGDFDVSHCHLNVWSLPGLFGHRPMLFDVGVLFTAPAELRAMHMVIPAPVARVRDLSAETARNDVGRLLFGRTFVSASDSRLDLATLGTVRVVPIEERFEIQHQDRDLTALRLVLGQVRPGERSYVRARFAIDHGGVMWRWQRVLGRRNGALIDFRVPDPREGGQEKKRALLEGRAKPIPEMNAFFMLPERFQLHSSNPELTYTRTLEGDRWEPYLRRRVGGIARRERIMVHRWRATAISEQQPFRGFLQFNREPRFIARTDLFILAFLMAAVPFALFDSHELRGAANNMVNWLGSELEALIDEGVRALVAAGVVALALGAFSVFRRWKQAPKTLTSVRRRFKRAEYWCFNKFGR